MHGHKMIRGENTERHATRSGTIAAKRFNCLQTWNNVFFTLRGLMLFRLRAARGDGGAHGRPHLTTLSLPHTCVSFCVSFCASLSD